MEELKTFSESTECSSYTENCQSDMPENYDIVEDYDITEDYVEKWGEKREDILNEISYHLSWELDDEELIEMFFELSGLEDDEGEKQNRKTRRHILEASMEKLTGKLTEKLGEKLG